MLKRSKLLLFISFIFLNCYSILYIQYFIWTCRFLTIFVKFWINLWYNNKLNRYFLEWVLIFVNSKYLLGTFIYGFIFLFSMEILLWLVCWIKSLLQALYITQHLIKENYSSNFKKKHSYVDCRERKHQYCIM